MDSDPLRRFAGTRALGMRWPRSADPRRTGQAFPESDVSADVQAAKALLHQGFAREAADALRRLLSVQPSSAEVCRYLICALEMQGDLTETVGAWYHLAELLRLDRCYRDAVLAYRTALARKPDCLRALVGLGWTHLGLAEPHEANRCFEAALAVAPDNPDVHFHLGSARHLMGDAEGGWDGFGWYYHPHRLRSRQFEQPVWDGSYQDTKSILVWTEMGRGDVIQFLRYVPFIAERCRKVIVLCNHSSLVPLIERMSGVASVVALGSPIPHFDIHVPLLFLPSRFTALRAPLFNHVPYLNVEPASQESWRRRLTKDSRLTVGLSWAGNADTYSAESRFMTLMHLAPLANVPGLRFVSLQHGEQAAELANPPAGLLVERIVDNSTSISDIAALILNLDLVISVDTMVAHIAGAVGQTTWMLLRKATNWRWGLTGHTTDWYPTMRLFRQTNPDSWPGAVEQLRQALDVTARSHAQMNGPP